MSYSNISSLSLKTVFSCPKEVFKHFLNLYLAYTVDKRQYIAIVFMYQGVSFLVGIPGYRKLYFIFMNSKSSSEKLVQ